MQEGHRTAQPSKHATDKVKTPKWTYRQMTRLVNGASRRQIPVILVDMPKERRYELQADFPDAARSAGAEVVDCQDASSMLQGRFVDGHHMDESGASIFSRELARRLWARFPHLLGRPGTNSPPIKRSDPNGECSLPTPPWRRGKPVAFFSLRVYPSFILPSGAYHAD
jgi:hypothetical protein